MASGTTRDRRSDRARREDAAGEERNQGDRGNNPYRRTWPRQSKGDEAMKTEPQKEHQWLQQLVGEWTYEGEATMVPGQPPSKFDGSERVRSLGGLWILAEGQGEMPGCGAATTVLTLGYDPQQQRYVGTWIGSMMTHLWLYEGSLDAAGRVLTLNAEGPDMAAAGKMAQYKDVIDLKSDDHRVLTSHMRGEDGEWHGFMTAHYRRVK
jgi:hypothetical protein